jgi:hypothetical protein
MKPILAYVHSLGIRASIYIDDGRILASTQEDAERFRVRVYQILRQAGWQLAQDKSDGEFGASQIKTYLGFAIDTRTMTVAYDAKKLDALRLKLIDACASSELHVKDLAKLLGKITSLIPSHGSAARICTKSGYAVQEAHVQAIGWKGRVQLTQAVKDELLFFAHNIEYFNNSPMEHELNTIKVTAILENPITRQSNVKTTRYDNVVVSDSSATKAAIKWIQGPLEGSTASFTFSVEEQATSSGHRELLAVVKMLEHCAAEGMISRASIVWATDSTNLVAFLSKGSSKRPIQQLIFKVLQICVSLRSVISPLHLYREDERIHQVDHLSKVKDTDNWSVDVSTFNSFDNDFQFEIDLFADSSNRKTDRFVSKFFDPLADAIDAFSIPWVGMAWVCPPTGVLTKVVRRIKTSKCQGLLIVPNWPASEFYCELFDKKQAVLAPFVFIREFYPYVIQNENATNTPLFGRTPFSFFALYFNTLC